MMMLLILKTEGISIPESKNKATDINVNEALLELIRASESKTSPHDWTNLSGKSTGFWSMSWISSNAYKLERGNNNEAIMTSIAGTLSRLDEIVHDLRDDEPLIDSILTHMGSMYSALGRFENSMLLYKRALDIVERNHGRSQDVWESPKGSHLFSFTIQMEDGSVVPLVQYVVCLAMTEAIKDLALKDDDDKYEFIEQSRVLGLVKNYLQFVSFLAWQEVSRAVDVTSFIFHCHKDNMKTCHMDRFCFTGCYM